MTNSSIKTGVDIQLITSSLSTQKKNIIRRFLNSTVTTAFSSFSTSKASDFPHHDAPKPCQWMMLNDSSLARWWITSLNRQKPVLSGGTMGNYYKINLANFSTASNERTDAALPDQIPPNWNVSNFGGPRLHASTSATMTAVWQRHKGKKSSSESFL